MNSRTNHSIITGGGSGIGLEVAQGLLTEHPENTNMVHSFDIHGPLKGVPGLMDHRVDISKADAVYRKVRDEIHGKVGLLVNNAGVLIRGGLLDVKPSDFHQMINVNVLGSWNMIKALLDQDRFGENATIVQMSSVVGGPDGQRLEKPIVGAYAMSKMFVHQMASEMKRALTEKRPDVNFKTVYPGAVETPMTTTGFESIEQYREQATRNWGVVSTAQEMSQRIIGLIESDASTLYWDAQKQEYVME